jgi:hypothetical protein
MSNWIIISIIILIVLFFILKKSYSSSSILTIIIWINNNSFGVQYKYNKLKISSVDWVWLCVLLPARMLFKGSSINELTNDPVRINKTLSENQLIKHTLFLLGNNDWKNESDIQQLTNNKINVSETRLQGERLRASLFYLGKEVRSVLLPFSPCESRFHDIWLAVLITSLNYINDPQKHILKNAFNEMHQLYMLSDVDSLEASHEIPRKALLKALSNN